MTGNRVAALVFCAAAGAAGLVYYRAANRRDAAAAEKPAPVRVAARPAISTVTATGTIRLRSGAEVRVGAQISGILTRLNVTVGAHVEKDEIVAEIESRGLDARISQAQSQIEIDEAALRKIQREAARTTQLLDAGLIARQQAEDLEDDLRNAQARLEKSRSDLAVVRSDLPYLTIRAPIAGTVASVASTGSTGVSTTPSTKSPSCFSYCS